MSQCDAETLPSDLRGEAALALLPPAGPPLSEVMLFGESVRHIDAWGGAALRAKIEYLARYQQRRVILSLPAEQGPRDLLHALVRYDHPQHLVLPSDTTHTSRPTPRNVLLSARSIRSLDHAEAIAEDLFDRASGRLAPAIRFVAKYLPELVLNALTHATDSPIRPVACALHDRDEDEVQLVICDLGMRIARRTDAADALDAAVTGAPEGGLHTLADSATRRGVDASLTLASGTGRLYWRAGQWHKATVDPKLPGFTVALTLPI